MNPKEISDPFCKCSIDLLDQSMIKIRHCMKQLSAEQVWWRPDASINSIGNLCLHLAGNLKQWGIMGLTDFPDQRQRESEFSADVRIESSELLRDLESVVAQAIELWRSVTEDELMQKTTIQGFEVTWMQALSHTSSHFVGHTHQIIMLTRMQLGDDYRFQWAPETADGDVPI